MPEKQVKKHEHDWSDGWIEIKEGTRYARHKVCKICQESKVEKL